MDDRASRTGKAAVSHGYDVESQGRDGMTSRIFLYDVMLALRLRK